MVVLNRGINHPTALRKRNKELIFEQILLHSTISRRDIERNTGLAPSTVSLVTSELLEEGFINRIGSKGIQGAGRKTDILSKNKDRECLISVSLTFENNRIALIDFNLDILEIRSLHIPRSDAETVLAVLKTEIRDLVAGHPDCRISTLSLALPHHPFDWDAIRAGLEGFENLETLMINNVEAMAVFDHLTIPSGASQGSVFYIFIGKGIGSAFIINGRLFLGDGGFASDLGHIHITDGDDLCRCGRKGCLEAVASEAALAKALGERLPGTRDSSSLLDTLKKGIASKDEDVQEILRTCASFIAEAIHTVISLLDPSSILVCTRLNELNPFFSSAVEAALYEKLGARSPFKHARSYLPFNQDSGIKGAALFGFLARYCGWK